MKIAIVGGAKASFELAPYDDPEWEIWALGNQMDRHGHHRITRIFEIHDDLSEHDPKYAKWLTDFNIPLIVRESFPEKVSHASAFPLEADVLGKLSSSPAYMMALAIHEGATHIGIYGIDMSVNDHEYFKQRPDMYAWIGYAMGKGIEITIPDESPLFKGNYDEGRDWGKSNPFSEESFLEMAELHRTKQNEVLFNALPDDKKDQVAQIYQIHEGCVQSFKSMARIARSVESGQSINSISEQVNIYDK